MPAEQKVTRKLSAILSADVKGYSILMADDEVHTIETLKSHRQIISNLINEHSGRVVDSPGDNILAEFRSVVDAVNCAVKVQRKLKQENSKFVDEKKVQFRIGVNIGDVIQDGDRIYGNGINVAARIEGLAEPGGVFISRNAYDHIRDKLDLGYEYLGEHSVKNIKQPVRVYNILMDPEYAGKLIGVKKKVSKLKWIFSTVVVFIVITAGIAGGLYWKYFYLPNPENIDPGDKMTFDLPKGPTIAVLSFDNMTGNPEQEFLSDGITENIIYALSHVHGLFVIARNSTFSYKGKSKNVQEIGDELGAQYVIEGSIQKFDEQIRITVQLVETHAGNHLWSDIFDRKLIDFFKLQDEIAMQICEAMQIQITEGETFRNRYRGITDVNIGIKLLKALQILRYKHGPESILLGFGEIEDVIKMDPEIQTAYILYGLYNLLLIEMGLCNNPIICFGKATEAAKKAMSLGENTSDMHILMAYLYLMRKEHENAIKEAKLAITSNPNNGDAYMCFGFVLNYSDRPNEAIPYLKKAIRIDPIPPSMYLLHLGIAYQESRQYSKAIELFKRILDKEPDHRAALHRLAGTYSLMGEEEKARTAALELLRVYPRFKLSDFLSKMPYKNRAVLEGYIDALRKAGLPD